MQLIDAQQATYLAHDAFDKPEVAAGDAGDGIGGLGAPDGVEREAELLPVMFEDLGGVSSGCRGRYWWANPILL